MKMKDKGPNHDAYGASLGTVDWVVKEEDKKRGATVSAEEMYKIYIGLGPGGGGGGSLGGMGTATSTSRIEITNTPTEWDKLYHTKRSEFERAIHDHHMLLTTNVAVAEAVAKEKFGDNYEGLVQGLSPLHGGVEIALKIRLNTGEIGTYSLPVTAHHGRVEIVDMIKSLHHMIEPLLMHQPVEDDGLCEGCTQRGYCKAMGCLTSS